jgi:hypothetical protein
MDVKMTHNFLSFSYHMNFLEIHVQIQIHEHLYIINIINFVKIILISCLSNKFINKLLVKIKVLERS